LLLLDQRPPGAKPNPENVEASKKYAFESEKPCAKTTDALKKYARAAIARIGSGCFRVFLFDSRKPAIFIIAFP
jgi:hypothetical protein